MAIAYAFFAGLWILLSDRAVVWAFSDPAQIAAVSTIKGWLFVAVTSLLLYGLIRRLLDQAHAISQRERAAEQEKWRTRLLLDAIADGSPDAIFAKDLDGRYQLFNREAARLVGKTPEEVIGSDDNALFPPAQAELVRSVDRRTIAEQKAISSEDTLSTTDGERTFHSIKRPLCDADGRVIGVFGIARDVTERKRVEAALLDRDFKLGAIVQHSPSALSLKDIDGRYALANPNLQRIHHLTEEQIIGKTDFELYPEEIARCLRSNDDLVLQTQARQSIEEIIPVDGQLRTFMSHMFPVADASGVTRFICRISLDITDRKKAEQELRTREREFSAFFHSDAFGATMIGLDGRFLRVNEAFCKITGYTDEELLQMHAADLIYPDDLKQTTAALSAYLHQGAGSTYKSEYRYVCKDGRIAWVQVDAALVCDASGKALYSAGTIHDITQRKLDEERLNAAVVDVARANNAKSRYLAAASHDLRQPMTALRLYTDVLKSSAAPTQQAIVASMEDCTSVMTALLTGLLDLSKLDAGVVKPSITNFSVFELLADLESIYYPRAQEKGLELHFHPSRLTGHSDPILIERIIGNFIDNAIRYTFRGGVLVGCRRRQGKTWVEVWDSGIGISADQLTEIFEEFKQLGDGARTQGSGLGLAIAEKSAALLGLKISVRSKPGRGSVFAIELPVGHPEAVQVPAKDVSAPPALRIALVEDNRMVRDALVAALQRAGHQVIAADSGSALLVELGEFRPEAIVSDYRLAGGETGYDVIDTVRKATKTDLPAIIITGDTDPTLIAKMAERGVAVLHKPMKIEELQTRLAELNCGTRRAGDGADICGCQHVSETTTQ